MTVTALTPTPIPDPAPQPHALIVPDDEWPALRTHFANRGLALVKVSPPTARRAVYVTRTDPATIDVPNAIPTGAAALTNRERQILVLMATGLTNPQIGGRLWLAEDTVKTHLRHVFKKLGARTRLEAAMIGIAVGLIQAPDLRRQGETS